MATSKTKAEILAILGRVYKNIYQRSSIAAKYIKLSVGADLVKSAKAISDTGTSNLSRTDLIAFAKSMWKDMYTRNGKAAKYIEIAIGKTDLANMKDMVS